MLVIKQTKARTYAPEPQVVYFNNKVKVDDTKAFRVFTPLELDTNYLKK